MRVLPLGVALLLCCACGGALRAAEPVGLPIVSAYASVEVGGDALSFGAIQHPSGVLFFGANELLRYDGERWTRNPLPGTYALRGLDFGPDGRLWTGAVNDLGWFDDPTGKSPQFHSLRAKLPAEAWPLGQVWRAYAEGDGATFVTSNQILRWDGTRFDRWPLPGSLRLLAMRVQGTVYVDHSEDGVYAVRARGPELFIPRAKLGAGGVFWMEARADGWLLVTSRGLRLYRDGQVVPFAPAVSEIVSPAGLTSAVRLLDGRYAIGTIRSGIILMQHNGALERVLRDDVLPTRAVTALFVDRDGELWGTSYSAIFRVDMTSLSTVFDERAGLPPQSYRSITRFQNRLLVSSERGVYERAGNGPSFLLSPTIQELVDGLHVVGGHLFATGLGWAKQLDAPEENRIIYRSNGTVFAAAASVRHPGAIYLSEDKSIIRRDPDGVTTTVVQGLPDITRSIVEDDAGHLWLASITGGLLFATPEPGHAVQAHPVPASYGLPALRGRTLHRTAHDGAMLVFAENGGWFRPAGAPRFRPIAKYPARTMTAAAEIAPDGTTWVGYPATERLATGVARITIDGNTARWEPHAVDGLEAAGLPRSIFTETDADGATILWIGGTRAVLRHVVPNGPVAPPPRPPVLRVFAYRAANDTPHAITAPLPYTTQRIEFEFAAPEFSRRAALRLETRIAEVDSDWVPASRDSRRELTALRDGRYSFQVRAVAETGAVSAPTAFTFEVLPPIWRTPVFLACVFLALLPVGYGGYRLRIRQLQRRTEILEARVRERTEELVRASAAKTQFVANISHDIRNPLNGIVGLALALEDSKLSDRQTEIVATLRECTTYLSSLVDDVLDFASIEAGKVELRPRRYAPVELLRSISETMKADTISSGAELALRIAENVPPHLEGDTGRIQQILVNFVSNALKYAGGEITLTVSLPDDSPGEVEFAVTDRGPGISAEQQPQLFSKFTRLRPTHGSERIPGTGLGLAACRLLADIMGGSVGVQSASGEGARFFLRLPLTVATADPEPTDVQLPNGSVLLVEDTDYNAWAASAVLAKLGLTCERARTGAEAIARFGARRFNIVLLDRNLPDMDGTEVARQLRALEGDALPAVLLAVTAYCTAEDRAHCLEAGMDAFVGKPLTPDKLRQALLTAGRRQLAAATLQAAAPANAQAVDFELLSYLADGSAEGLQRQLQRFVESLREGERQIQAAAAAANFPELARAAHALRGQARMVGYAPLATVAANLEAAAAAARGPESAAALTQVAAEVHTLTAIMLRHRPAARSA